MKKVFILLLMILFVISVQADELPTIISHKVMVTNKEGTICYNDGKKTKIIIPYKTMLMVKYDINGSYINVTNDDYDCDVKFSDVSANIQKFSLDNKDVEKISSMQAIVLPSSGLNMRMGPSVTYAKITIIPKNSLITLTHKAGTYWYYTEYNGKTGWVTAMNKYLGYDYDKILINYEKTNIYNSNGNKIVGSIPENTEITDYIKLPHNKEGLVYYIKYQNVEGYIKDMLYKTNGIGKIKLIKDVDLKDENGNPIKRMLVGTELEYNMVNDNGFYFPEKKTLISLSSDDYDYVKEAKVSIKDKGYLGEGIFGEEKKEREKPVVEKKADNELDIKNDKGITTKEIVIICLLSGIFILLIILVIIKIISNKNKDKIIKNREGRSYNE